MFLKTENVFDYREIHQNTLVNVHQATLESIAQKTLMIAAQIPARMVGSVRYSLQ